MSFKKRPQEFFGSELSMASLQKNFNKLRRVERIGQMSDLEREQIIRIVEE